ncbi:hypothetical protein H1C71_021358 [Ictidomys tridecemlineatus]|nr:hypothetical protein H1C71_021358 [Ictidomys tridecemlineatus]
MYWGPSLQPTTLPHSRCPPLLMSMVPPESAPVAGQCRPSVKATERAKARRPAEGSLGQRPPRRVSPKLARPSCLSRLDGCSPGGNPPSPSPLRQAHCLPEEQLRPSPIVCSCDYQTGQEQCQRRKRLFGVLWFQRSQPVDSRLHSSGLEVGLDDMVEE